MTDFDAGKEVIAAIVLASMKYPDLYRIAENFFGENDIGKQRQFVAEAAYRIEYGSMAYWSIILDDVIPTSDDSYIFVHKDEEQSA